MQPPQRIPILDVKVSAVNLDSACAVIDQYIQTKNQGYVCVAPVSTIVSCQENQEYKNVVNSAMMVTPDGMPIVWIARALGYKKVRRTYGPDLTLAVCGYGQDKGYRHFFYGGTAQVCQKLETVLKEKFPRINIAGSYAPPFRDLSEDEEEKVTRMINRAQPDVLWVGLGSPKQDFWMKRTRVKLNVPVTIGVGAAFDFLSGAKRQAPRWMQRCGLEWIFRLGCEPRRLWRRYLIGNSKFIYFLIKDTFKKRVRRLA